jgi:ribosomal protein S18 acetylase RimI-like enzyme
MMLPNLKIESNPDSDDLEFIDNQINEFNVAQTNYHDFRWLAAFIRDDTGNIMAGITGFTWGKSCRIQSLWVHPNLRGQGYGHTLMQAAEHEAMARDCHVIVLETHSFQAPGFYQKLGYTVSGYHEDYPYHHREYFLHKRLV